ncbi:unnamed protein product [Leuciscus chuanchicus]
MDWELACTASSSVSSTSPCDATCYHQTRSGQQKSHTAAWRDFYGEGGRTHAAYTHTHTRVPVCSKNCTFPPLVLSYTFMVFLYVSELISVSWISSGHFPKPFLDFIFSAVRKTVVKTHIENLFSFARERHQKCATVHEHSLKGTLAGSFRGDLRSEVTCDSRLEEFSLKEMNSIGGNKRQKLALPLFGASLQKPFREYLEAQRAKLQHRTGRAGGSKGEATPIGLRVGRAVVGRGGLFGVWLRRDAESYSELFE